MSSFAWMKFLESSPERYDTGIHLLSQGRIDAVYQRLAELAAGPDRRVLDVGCGTGAVSLACAARGAHVTGIDINAGMLEVARHKPVPGGSVEFVELGVAEIVDRFAENTFDAVVSCLAFSELSPDEQRYALKVALERLKPGGLLVIADETLPRDPVRRFFHRVKHWPRSALTWLLTQASTQPVADLAGRLRAAGFVEVEEERLWADTFFVTRGKKPGASA